MTSKDLVIGKVYKDMHYGFIVYIGPSKEYGNVWDFKAYDTEELIRCDESDFDNFIIVPTKLDLYLAGIVVNDI